MEFGLSCNKIDEVGVAVHAENLGYDFCGMTDSPMIRSNVWAVMALVAQQTQRPRIGTGVAVQWLASRTGGGERYRDDQSSRTWSMLHRFGDR